MMNNFMINLIEEKFSSLISDQKLAISDEPFLIENFIDIKKYISSENILNDAINSDSVFWDIYDTAGPKLEIPFKRPYWSPTKQQHKLFIMEAINAGCTYVILKCSTLNEKLKRLTVAIQNCFHTTADIHVYGSKGKGGSFIVHADLPANFILQLEGETQWIVFNNKVSSVLSMADVLQKKMKFHLEGFNLEDFKQNKGLEPIINKTLKPGDLLYIPSRYYHCALPSSPRMSLSIPCVNTEILDADDLSGRQMDLNIYKF